MIWSWSGVTAQLSKEALKELTKHLTTEEAVKVVAKTAASASTP